MAPNPMQMVKEELKLTDYLQFLDDKSKQIGLEKAQKDSVKALNKQMDEQQKPVLKQMEKMFSDAERAAAQGGGGFRGGGGGGDDAGGGGRGRGGMSEEGRLLMSQLVTIQEDYSTKAKALLNENQKHVADSLNIIYRDDLQKRQRNRNRGRG